HRGVLHPVDREQTPAALRERNGKDAVIKVRGEHALYLEPRGMLQTFHCERSLTSACQPELRIGERVIAHLESCHRRANARRDQSGCDQRDAPHHAGLSLFGFARHYPAPRRPASSLSPACDTLPAPSVSSRSPGCAAASIASTPRSIVPAYSAPRCPN